MSKAVTSPVIIEGISTRRDNSISLRLSTPELKPDEKLVFLELQGQELKALFQPIQTEAVELKEVKAEFDEKTCSQRLRATLWLLWRQTNEAVDFEVYYKSKMNGIIEHLKTKLNPS